jgi:hypothetical protein
VKPVTALGPHGGNAQVASGCMCEPCRKARYYAQRKAAGLCAVGGCKDAPEAGKSKCRHHLDVAAARVRAWAEKRRAS